MNTHPCVLRLTNLHTNPPKHACTTHTHTQTDQLKRMLRTSTLWREAGRASHSVCLIPYRMVNKSHHPLILAWSCGISTHSMTLHGYATLQKDHNLIPQSSQLILKKAQANLYLITTSLGNSIYMYPHQPTLSLSWSKTSQVAVMTFCQTLAGEGWVVRVGGMGGVSGVGGWECRPAGSMQQAVYICQPHTHTLVLAPDWLASNGEMLSLPPSLSPLALFSLFHPAH